MSAPFRDSRLPGAFVVMLPEADGFAFWRERARGLVQCDVPPDRVAWVEPGGARDLFARGAPRLPSAPAGARPVRASKAFVELAQSAACHSDPGRFALLYRLLWRLQRNPRVPGIVEVLLPEQHRRAQPFRGDCPQSCIGIRRKLPAAEDARNVMHRHAPVHEVVDKQRAAIRR